MQSTSQKREQILPAVWIISLILLVLLISVSENKLLVAIIAILIVSILFFSFIFWFHFAYPPGISNPLLLFYHLLISILTGREPILIVQNGKISHDYFFINKKPAIPLVYIDRDSCAVSQRPNGEIKELKPGLNLLQRREIIVFTFDLRFQDFLWGPGENEDPFQVKSADESHTDFHARQLQAQKTRGLTQDHSTIYPGFHISYQLENQPIQKESTTKNSSLKIAQYLLEQNLNGEANPLINEILGKTITRQWNSFIRKKNLNDVFLSRENMTSPLSEFLISINKNVFNQSYSSQTNPVTNQSDKNLNPLQEIALWEIPTGKVYLDCLWLPPEKRIDKEASRSNYKNDDQKE
jgi:hypothetical protein